MTRTSYLTRRRFVKTASMFCATLAGAGALSACAVETDAAPATTDDPADATADTGASANTPSATQEAATPAEPQPEESAATPAAAGSVLVAYFSYPETSDATDPDNLTDAEENSVVVKDGEIIGSTQYVADIITRETGADTFRILTTRTYPADHQALINQAQQEINSGDRPDLVEPIPDLSAYETVFIGHPIWWAELPPVMHSFLEQADLAGKQVYLFNTHGGSGNAGTKEEIKNILAAANVSDDNFVVSRDAVDACESDVLTWLQGLGF